MSSLFGFDKIAGKRGDGLDPRLRAAFAPLEPLSVGATLPGNVISLSEARKQRSAKCPATKVRHVF